MKNKNETEKIHMVLFLLTNKTKLYSTPYYKTWVVNNKF